VRIRNYSSVAPIGIHLRNQKNVKMPPIRTFLCLVLSFPRFRCRVCRLAIRAARFVLEADFPFRALGKKKNTSEEFRKVEKNEGALREQ
jgi:hypothetical protein